MALGSVFTNVIGQGCTPACRVRFPDTVSKVTVRVVGKSAFLPHGEYGTASSVRKMRWSDDFLNEHWTPNASGKIFDVQPYAGHQHCYLCH